MCARWSASWAGSPSETAEFLLGPVPAGEGCGQVASISNGGVKRIAPALLYLASLPLFASDAEWFPFTPSNRDFSASAIGLGDWNREPAGLHGRIQRQGDRLIYNGREIKLWGTNIGFSSSAPTREQARQLVDYYVMMGLNSLRHHKHLDGPGWHGLQSDHSFVRFDAEKLDRFDYFNQLLKQAGIYWEHSPNFGIRFGRDDLDRVPYWREIGELSSGNQPRVAALHGWVNLARELQDLQIEQTVNLLNHRNPYTGLRYAEDPALFAVEFFNEDSVLFYSTNGVLQRSPTIRTRTAREFSEWLLKKYGNEAAWKRAWGGEAIVDNPSRIGSGDLRNLISPQNVTGGLAAESLANRTVVPWGHPWFYDAAMEPGSHQAPLRQRFLDTMEFLVSLQDAFYDRFTTAVRATGFTGEIVHSNWQAGSQVGHLLNLYSDARSGIVDRHNYYAGGGFNGLRENVPFHNLSTLRRSGGGNFTAGFQQVEGAVFMLSEWTHEQPNEWSAEGPVTIGAYGFGLQGWDASFHFLFGERSGFSNRLGINTWDASNPAIAVTFPAVSRMVRRMDVREAPETFHLNAHRPSLLAGRMSFLGETFQDGDQKDFKTDKAPVEALAATRVAVRFTDTFEDTPQFDLSPFLDGRTVVSSTGELRWTPSDSPQQNGGHVVIRTRGTKGFVGFASGEETFDLGEGFTITPGRGFSVILLTAMAPDRDLLTDERILVTTVARVRNTGMTFNEAGNVITARGGPPILMEPVRARIGMPFGGRQGLLDHDGREITASREFQGVLEIDTASDRTPFHLLAVKR